MMTSVFSIVERLFDCTMKEEETLQRSSSD